MINAIRKNRVLQVVILFIAILMYTNPSIRESNEYLKGREMKVVERSNFFIFSIIEGRGNKGVTKYYGSYFCILGNHFTIDQNSHGPIFLSP